MRALDRTASRCRRSVGSAGRLPRSLCLAAVAAIGAILAGCNDDQSFETARLDGNPQRGIALIQQNGCGSCHVIPGIENANGFVGPPLTGVGRRIYLAGVERNTPQGMVAWLQNPQAIVPGNAMPDMRLDQRDARDIAAYLFTLQ